MTIAAPLAGNVLGNLGDDFIVAEWRDAGGGDDPPRLIAPLHVHHSDDEAWYVLDGVLRIRRGDEEIEARPGSAVLVRKGQAHTYWNPTKEPARYLLIMTPNIFRLIQEIHELKERTPDAVKSIFTRHDSTLL